MDKEDLAYQRKLALQGLMENAGMKILKNDLDDDWVYALNEINKAKGPVDHKALSKLNFDLGRKAGLEMVLNRLAGYEDDLIGDDVKPPKK